MINPRNISISEYTYHLPSEKIAQFPLAERDRSKLLLYSNGCIENKIFHNLSGLLPLNSLLVLNNTKVIKARLLFRNRAGGKVELFLLEPSTVSMSEGLANLGSVVWKVMVGGVKKWKDEELLYSSEKIILRAKKLRINSNIAEVKFSWTPKQLSFDLVLEMVGNIPLPPYMKRNSLELDEHSYQTTYHKIAGSVAAPTAGLHITEKVIFDLRKSGIKLSELTLNVGAGTFQPVKSTTMNGHQMHAESIEVSIETITQIRNQLGNSIVPVGTTSARTIESLYWIGVKILMKKIDNPDRIRVNQWECYDLPQDCSTDLAFDSVIEFLIKNNRNKLLAQTQIIIVPGYRFRVATALITNFHQPNSTLLLLVAALVGDNWRKIYDFALKNNYRFLSYGDSSLLFSS